MNGLATGHIGIVNDTIDDPSSCDSFSAKNPPYCCPLRGFIMFGGVELKKEREIFINKYCGYTRSIYNNHIHICISFNIV